MTKRQAYPLLRLNHDVTRSRPDNAHRSCASDSRMGWITDQLRRVAKLESLEHENPPSALDDSSPSQSVWVRLQNGIQQDAEEFRRSGGECKLDHVSDNQVRLLNSGAGIAAVITADLDAKTIEYRYEAERDSIAVPEQGILTIRRHGKPEQLYSADQPVSPEQARRMILEPALFPDLPTDQAVA